MSLTSEALLIQAKVVSQLVDLFSESLDKEKATEQEREQFKQQAADLISASKTEDQTNSADLAALTAKVQAVIDKSVGATPAPAASTAPVSTPATGDASAPATPTSGTPVTPPTTGDVSTPNPVASGTPAIPATGDASAPTDGTPNTPVVNTNPVGDTSASTTAK